MYERTKLRENDHRTYTNEPKSRESDQRTCTNEPIREKMTSVRVRTNKFERKWLAYVYERPNSRENDQRTCTNEPNREKVVSCYDRVTKIKKAETYEFEFRMNFQKLILRILGWKQKKILLHLTTEYPTNLANFRTRNWKSLAVFGWSWRRKENRFLIPTDFLNFVCYVNFATSNRKRKLTTWWI